MMPSRQHGGNHRDGTAQRRPARRNCLRLQGSSNPGGARPTARDLRRLPRSTQKTDWLPNGGPLPPQSRSVQEEHCGASSCSLKMTPRGPGVLVGQSEPDVAPRRHGPQIVIGGAVLHDEGAVCTSRGRLHSMTWAKFKNRSLAVVVDEDLIATQDDRDESSLRGCLVASLRCSGPALVEGDPEGDDYGGGCRNSACHRPRISHLRTLAVTPDGQEEGLPRRAGAGQPQGRVRRAEADAEPRASEGRPARRSR